MNIPVPDAGVRDGGREEITTIDFKIEMPGGSTETVKVGDCPTPPTPLLARAVAVTAPPASPIRSLRSNLQGVRFPLSHKSRGS